MSTAESLKLQKAEKMVLSEAKSEEKVQDAHKILVPTAAESSISDTETQDLRPVDGDGNDHQVEEILDIDSQSIGSLSASMQVEKLGDAHGLTPNISHHSSMIKSQWQASSDSMPNLRYQNESEKERKEGNDNEARSELEQNQKKLDSADDVYSLSGSLDKIDDSSIQSESSLWKFRMLCGRLVNNEYIQVGIIVLILINALMMGLATFDFVTESDKTDEIFTKIDRGFLIIFTIECLMQLLYLGLSLFADGWLAFDFLIVVFSWSFESLQIVRAFRIFRAFRLITRVKALRDLVLAIGAVMPRMYAIASLLLLIFYIFSVLFTELFSDLQLTDNYFSTLHDSLFTCMEMMTLEWGEIAREVMTYETWAWAPFTAFIMITGFIVFNLIVAVVCDAVALTEKNTRELDGFELNSPEQNLSDAQERIDLLQVHINDMLRTQQQTHEMIEMLAAELLCLESRRGKEEQREAELRIEMVRRMEYEKSMQSAEQVASLERNYVLEKEKRQQERSFRDLVRQQSARNEEEEQKAPFMSLGAPVPSPKKVRSKRRRSMESLQKSKLAGSLRSELNTSSQSFEYDRSSRDVMTEDSSYSRRDGYATPNGSTRDISRSPNRSQRALSRGSSTSRRRMSRTSSRSSINRSVSRNSLPDYSVNG